MGLKVIRPGCGSRPAIMVFNQSRAPVPLTLYLPKLCISVIPTAVRTVRHSLATALKAFERRKLGVSNNGSP